MGDADLDELVDKLQEPRFRFIHPCNCTLVCHESCLLEWIHQQHLQPTAQLPVKCPQCLHVYRLVTEKTVLLRFFERMSHFASFALATGVVGAGFSGACAVAYSYGKLALRAWVGNEAADRFAEDNKRNFFVSHLESKA